MCKTADIRGFWARKVKSICDIPLLIRILFIGLITLPAIVYAISDWSADTSLSDSDASYWGEDASAVYLN